MMHQRAAQSSSRQSIAVSTVSPDGKVRRLRKKKKAGSRSHSRNNLLQQIPRDMLVAIVGTVVLTTVSVLLVLRLLTFVTTPRDTTINADLAHLEAVRHRPNGGDDNWSGSGGGFGGNVLPYNPLYRVPDSIATVGDRSDWYVQLRMQTDPFLPMDGRRSVAVAQDLQNAFVNQIPASMGENKNNNNNKEEEDVHQSDPVDHTQAVGPAYDIYNCPDDPPPGYPYQWNMMQLLDNWNPNDTDPPPTIHQGLCVFDFETDHDKALVYRALELPFVVANDPAVAATVERWNRPGYMERLLGVEEHRAEFSENNHFMYYTPVSHKKKKKKNGRLRAPEGWTAPTKMMRMSFPEWVKHANVTDESRLGPDNPHWYFRLIGCGSMGNDGSCDQGSSEYLYDELPFFQPKETLYIVEPEEQKGIHCRFGMKGVIAENHFDGSRNSIVVLKGSRRYILTHPNQCEKLALYPKGHPSARHSAVDWTDPDLEEYPDFADASANEIVLLPGQVLYLPTEWFHFIVSLDLNYQCNSRSGITDHYKEHIHECGF